MHEDDLTRFLDDFRQCKERLMDTTKYNDKYFQGLHKLVKNVRFFRSISFTSARKLTHQMKKRKYEEGQVIINFQELDSNFYFLLEGQVKLYIPSSEDEDFEWLEWETLKPGSSFNICSSILQHYSLFRAVCQSDCQVMTVNI